MSTRLSKIVLRASTEGIPKREKFQIREGGFLHSFVLRVCVGGVYLTVTIDPVWG
jgi:hypothetical protein